MKADKIQKLGVELERLIEEERSLKEEKRLQTLRVLFNDFIIARNVQGVVYLNDDLLAIVVKSYFDDIYRIKAYTHSVRLDQHKQSAYLIKWISKIRPIQILPNVSIADRRILLINSSFAIFAGFSFLSLKVSNCITPEFYKHLLYMCQYRNISGRQLATTLYVLEQRAESERP